LTKPLFLAVLSVALAAYGFDCDAMATPEQAMQCCDSMPCPLHGHHGEDCCKTMPTVHAPIAQPTLAHGITVSPLVFAVIPASDESHGLDSAARSIAALCHAPPISDSYSAASLPLRI